MAADADKANILVVDDLHEKRLAYDAVLEELGENVVSVSSGAEALKQVLKSHFAVILLDVNMPDMDGFETARLIRGHRRSSSTPIIFLTAFADEVRSAEGYATGAVDYIPTPIVPEILRAKVRVFVELYKMRRLAARRAEETARHAAAEEANRRLTFLADAGAVLGRSLDFAATARDIVRLPVPLLADVCVLSVAPAAGAPGALLLARVDQNHRAVVEEVADADAVPEPLRHALQQAISRGESVVVPTKSAALTSVMAVPLHARGRIVATLAIQRTYADSSAERHDLAIASAYASRAATALDNTILHEELQRADRQKIDFLSMLAHELRNPLAPICNAVQLFRLHAPDDPDLQWAGDVVDRQVMQMVRLVDDLLDISRITCGKIRLQMQPVELSSIIAHAVEASQPLIDARNHHLTVALLDEPIWVNGDRARLAQVVTNLLNNAAKYTEEGGRIWVNVQTEGENVCVTVRDTGIGIPADMLASIFELFTQVERTLDRSLGGLGIGLTLVQRLVEMHGGQVTAHSPGPGSGSEFTITLPTVAPKVEPTNGSGESPAAHLAEHVSLRVLIVDDNADSADTLASLLRLVGHQVDVTYDGPSGLAAAQASEPGVVLLDIGLPGMDGYTVAARMRETEATRNALLIAISGYGQTKDELRSRQAGFDHHLVKPVEFEKLQLLLSPGRWPATVNALHG